MNEPTMYDNALRLANNHMQRQDARIANLRRAIRRTIKTLTQEGGATRYDDESIIADLRAVLETDSADEAV